MFLFRFLYYSSVWGMNKDQFDDLLTKYVESMTQQPEVTTYIGEIVRISDNPGPKEPVLCSWNNFQLSLERESFRKRSKEDNNTQDSLCYAHVKHSKPQIPTSIPKESAYDVP